MHQFGSQMRTFTNGPGDAVPQQPPSQPQHSAVSVKPAAGPPPKPHHNGVADVKPRLTKEQHDILEAHFQQHHKPSTTTKKGFAETLGVPLDKINNWFQNRRAKVKQDIKKQLNQYNMGMGVYGQPQMPPMNSQFPLHVEQPQPRPPMPQDFYPTNADISPTHHPVQNPEGTSALDLGGHMPIHAPYDMHSLRSIPEADRANTYHQNPNSIMQSFMAATAGASYMQNQAATLPPQESGFTYDSGAMAQMLPNTELSFSMPNGLPNVPVVSNEAFSDFPDFATFDFNSLSATNTTSSSVEAQNGTSSSSESPAGPNASSVTSIASVYSNWTDEQKKSSGMTPANDGGDMFENPYNMPQGAVSDHDLSIWNTNGQGPFSQADLYQHPNASAHAILSSPSRSEDRKPSMGHSDLEAPPSFGDDAYSRRNSSATNLASTIETIHIQNSQTPDGFKQPNQPSSIAARRQKRPTALNPSSFRSSSYSGGVPSPGGNNEHTLRRIRSSGIPNAAGRVQKPTPGSAQRSPMSMTFAEAAASPKFARTFSSSSTTTLGQGGSLAPPTPQTPNEIGRYPYWQSNTVIRNHAPMPDHSSPESMNASWSVEPQSAGVFQSGTSPPSTPLDIGQLNQARTLTDNMYRDTPPQSAPATQQSFPRTAFAPPPHMKAGFHSTSDLTIAQPKPSHFRRPSLPGTGQSQLNDSQMQFPEQFGDLQYDDKFGDLSLHGIHNVPFAPPACMPEFLVHQYSPPQGVGPGSLYRRTTEPQPKSYIFANQGPGDFR